MSPPLTVGDWLPGVLTAFCTIAGAYLVARFGARSEQAKTKAEKEIGSGELAFNIAKDLRDRVDKLQSHNDAMDSEYSMMRRMWWHHTRWDDALLIELVKAGVDVSKLPPKPPDLDFNGKEIP